MIVVLWKAAASTQAGEVGEWLCGHRQRIIIEYLLPKSAWSVVVLETEGMGPLNCRRTPPEIGLLTTDNPAEGMRFARRTFETCVALSGWAKGTQRSEQSITAAKPA